MIHLYYGKGKGKTTAAMGLALRAAGRGWHVVVAQFLKGSDTGERLALRKLHNVQVLDVPARMKFTWEMDEGERAAEGERCRALLREAETLAAWSSPALLVLDECTTAVDEGLLDVEAVERLLDRRGQECEVVLTGRAAPPTLKARAHYVTEMFCRRHPYDVGLGGREGVEW